MIEPRKVRFMAKKKQNENARFRTYLKMHADEKELDEQFLKLHNELFEGYDCNRCHNCCKMFYGNIPEEDVQKDAEYLKMSKEQFADLFLQKDKTPEGFVTMHMPCDFLQEDGNCRLGDCRPENCKKYPYTNQPERLASLLSVLSAVEVCPVAYEIFERLKEVYGFTTYR